MHIKIDEGNITLVEVGKITWKEYWERRIKLAGERLK